MKTKLIFLLGAGLLLNSFHVSAQQTINVSGNTAVIQGMSFDYSIGEMLLTATEKSGSLIVTQGFLQPSSTVADENSPNQSFDKLNQENILSVYPNPTENSLFIEMNDQYKGELFYNLLDLSGNTIAQGKCIPNQKQRIDLSSFANGIYFLQVIKQTQLQRETLSYQIQRIK